MEISYDFLIERLHEHQKESRWYLEFDEAGAREYLRATYGEKPTGYVSVFLLFDGLVKKFMKSPSFDTLNLSSFPFREEVLDIVKDVSPVVAFRRYNNVYKLHSGQNEFREGDLIESIHALPTTSEARRSVSVSIGGNHYDKFYFHNDVVSFPHPFLIWLGRLIQVYFVFEGFQEGDEVKVTHAWVNHLLRDSCKAAQMSPECKRHCIRYGNDMCGKMWHSVEDELLECTCGKK